MVIEDDAVREATVWDIHELKQSLGTGKESA
jgi:hypothetical protein